MTFILGTTTIIALIMWQRERKQHELHCKVLEEQLDVMTEKLAKARSQ